MSFVNGARGGKVQKLAASINETQFYGKLVGAPVSLVQAAGLA
jgi:hypothetical protein